jgi:hypothetical protein
MHYSDYTPTTAQEVLTTLERWFRKRPEILVRSRGQASGSEEFEFFSSFGALAERMRSARPYTWFTVFEQPQLPLRGVVDDDFIARCLSSVPDGSEYLFTETVLTVAGTRSWYHNQSGESHAMLRDDLEDSRGRQVAFGFYPPCLEERVDVIHAFTPDAEGVVTAGPY